MSGTATLLTAIEALVEAGCEDDARTQLAPLLVPEAPLDDEDLPRAAAVCESLGMIAAAVALLRRRLECDPRDTDAWSRLADLHDELGDFERALRCRRRGAVLDPDPMGDRPAPHPAASALVDLSFDDADLTRFLDLFAGREDAHARQWYDSARDRSGYSPVAAPLGHTALKRHLDGRQTLGAYLLRADDTVGFCVFDVDATRRALDEAAGDAGRVVELAQALEVAAQSLLSRLDALDLPFLYEDSGHKGRHAWVFFDRPVPASAALAFGRAVLAGFAPDDPRISIELFPKQARATGKGFGNLIKLPLGVHRVSGRRAWLLSRDGTVHVRPFKLLRGLSRLSSETLPRVTASARPPAGMKTPDPTLRRPPAPPAESWTARDFRTDPQYREVLGGCAVLRRLVQRGIAGDALEHRELVAIRHTLGHLERGPAGVNWLQRRLPAVPDAHLLRHRLAGLPSSCANLRRRLPGLARRVGCDCNFGSRLPTYPHPLLHLEGTRRAIHLRVLEGGVAPEDPAAEQPPADSASVPTRDLPDNEDGD